MADKVTGMQVFARVAALGSLSAAARALGMSQTMATKHLSALEDRLGTKLMHRTTRRLTLTDAGRNFLDAVERILSDIDEAEGAASAAFREVRGTLRINAPVSFGVRWVVPFLAEMAELHPELTLDLGLNDRYVDLIEEGWDVAIRIGALQNSSMIARRLAPCRTTVCAAPAYLARHGTPRSIADLARHRCLGYTLSRTVSPDRWAFGRDGTAAVSIAGPIRANNGDALVMAAVSGQGIAYLPTFLVTRELASGALVELRLDHPPTELAGVYAAYPAARRPPAKVRALIDLLAERYAPVPPWERS